MNFPPFYSVMFSFLQLKHSLCKTSLDSFICFQLFSALNFHHALRTEKFNIYRNINEISSSQFSTILLSFPTKWSGKLSPLNPKSKFNLLKLIGSKRARDVNDYSHL